MRFKLLLAAVLAAPAQSDGPDAAIPIRRQLLLPNREGSLRLAALGDNGTGGRKQYLVAEVMHRYHEVFPFELTLMLGDNLYGGKSPRDFVQKFEAPYRPLLQAGVKFYASLGNHDSPSELSYAPFNMNGERYYSFRAPRQSVRFFALDSNYMDPGQLAWLEKELAEAKEDWKICFFHHPLYSSGRRHGPDEPLREALEPLLVRHHVNLVLVGHEHFYERTRLQKGILHIISGGGGQLRRGNLRRGDADFVAGYDQGRHFLLLEIHDDHLHFQAVAEDGTSVDAGILERKAPGEVIRIYDDLPPAP